jgi:predicted O-linked N-acetylglucosamine transferase (SPINDLY family)
LSLRSIFGIGAGSASAALDQQIETGISRFEAGDPAGAEQAFGAVLACAPRHPRALSLMGVVRLAAGRAIEAEDFLRRAVAIDAAPYLAWFNLGNALAAQGRTADAAGAFEAAAQRAPQHFASWFNLVRARTELGETDAAIAACEHCVDLQPDDPSTLTELGMLRVRKGNATLLIAEFDTAINLLHRALALPDAPPATVHNARMFLGDALSKRGRHGEALALFRAVLRESPDDLDANINLANCLNTMGRIRDAAPCYEKVVRLYPAHLPAISSAISAANYADGFDAENNARWRRNLMRLFRDPQRHAVWPNPRDPGRRLRIGYVSPDFREHVAMTLMEGVLRHHDRGQFEIHVYDATAYRDARNRELRAHADHWREIDMLGTDDAERLVLADGIDVLVDLAGHTAGNRLMLFARKPAPVQATWLAYPGSTGLPEIDYIVSDPYTSPPACDDLYSEAVWRMPDSRFCFMPPAASPEPRLPGPDLPPTFGCFNNPSKINATVLALWKRILDEIPETRLLLKYATLDDADAREWLCDDLAAAGIPRARVEMRGWTRYVDTLDQYADMHVALDPFPFCGGLTSLDALWMGVPVVTLEQRQMAGRQTAAFLQNIGAAELIAADADAYVRQAVDLMRSSQRLADYRSVLRPALQASPLFDYPGFTRSLEAAWRGMWRRWCQAGQS